MPVILSLHLFCLTFLLFMPGLCSSFSTTKRHFHSLCSVHFVLSVFYCSMPATHYSLFIFPVKKHLTCLAHIFIPIINQLAYINVVSTSYPLCFLQSKLEMSLYSHSILPFKISLNLGKKIWKSWEILFWGVFLFFILFSQSQKGDQCEWP